MPDGEKQSVGPIDRLERSRALDPTRSFLVQAPAGSGKTYLLTQRFLRLLAQAEKPDEIVAITFTNAAAAEMRNRILESLEKAALEKVGSAADGDRDPESLPALAAKAMKRARLMGWQILDQPSQLRITTIDAFCRSLALQSPLSWGLLSGLGGRLDPVNQAGDLYRRAATRTIELLNLEESETRFAVEQLLRWRDNNWKDVEDLLADMLSKRNRWYQEFVFAREGDWAKLQQRLEAPFRRAACERLAAIVQVLDRLPESRDYALLLARGACECPGKSSPLSLAERAELPVSFGAEDGILDVDVVEDAVSAYRDLANFLLTKEGAWRSRTGINKNHGFPSGNAGKAAKERFGDFVDGLATEAGVQSALAAFQKPIPVRYTDEEWELIRHCFAVLRYAAGQLQVVFAETGSVDFTEVAQIALRILVDEDGSPSDFAIRVADGIHHLLIDEFQDTSRRQHELLSRLIAAWPDREGRSCFCVGDPMQSIYGFREAEVELFERLKSHGLETSSVGSEDPLRFEFVPLRANFRTVPTLVNDLNGRFESIFGEDDGSGVSFSRAEAARESLSLAKTELHLAFALSRGVASGNFGEAQPELVREAQLEEMVGLIRNRLEAAQELKKTDGSGKFRVAVLGRTRNSLIPVAEALRKAAIGYRAIELELLRERPEVLDALSLARALLNPTDRTAWLGVLRAPWCGLSLADLHLLTSGDDLGISQTPIPILLETRLMMLGEAGLLSSRTADAVSRVWGVLRHAHETRSAASTWALGTWLESVWSALGGDNTVGEVERANLHLLWAALDKLPDGELDLGGPGLDSALNELYALPDPDASSEFGVQLMTIHKSKGLEFEVVIVPDLEAGSRRSEKTMISWLERGLVGTGSEADELTEFLIAPIQAKGSDIGVAKRWVDGVKREREEQEMQRLLYVAATRAREELYLFARPRFRINRTGEPELAQATGLLETAWPAIGAEVQQRFDTWLAANKSAAEGDGIFETTLQIAAAAAESDGSKAKGNLLQMPATAAPFQPETRPTLIRRLPEGYAAPGLQRWSNSYNADRSGGGLSDEEAERKLYERTEGGLHSRLMGTAIHAFLERLSYLRRWMDPAEAAEGIEDALPAISARLRGRGLSQVVAERLAGEALVVAQRASIDPVGSWVLAPHLKSESEARWTGLISTASGRLQRWNLKPDRVFFAEPLPLRRPQTSSLESLLRDDGGDPCWWIIDYKTSDADGAILGAEDQRAVFLGDHRRRFGGQLEAYAKVLRGLGTGEGNFAGRIRAGIFYPRLLLLDHWEA